MKSAFAVAVLMLLGWMAWSIHRMTPQETPADQIAKLLERQEAIANRIVEMDAELAGRLDVLEDDAMSRKSEVAALLDYHMNRSRNVVAPVKPAAAAAKLVVPGREKPALLREQLKRIGVETDETDAEILVTLLRKALLGF